MIFALTLLAVLALSHMAVVLYKSDYKSATKIFYVVVLASALVQTVTL